MSKTWVYSSLLFVLFFSLEGFSGWCFNIAGQSKSQVEFELKQKIGENYPQLISQATKLDLNGRNLSKAEFKEVVSHLTRKTRNLYLSNNPQIGKKELIAALEKTQGISRLDVAFTSVGKAIIPILRDHAPRVSWLRTSELGYRGLFALRQLGNLRKIEISETKVSPRFITFMLRFFRPHLLNSLVMPDTSGAHFKRIHYLVRDFNKHAPFSVEAKAAGPEVSFVRLPKNVKDGDTFKLLNKKADKASARDIVIRLFGADTPETSSSNSFEVKMGVAAKHFVLHQLMYAKQIKVYTMASGKTEKYNGRELYMVEVDGKNLAELLIKKGLAFRYYGEQKIERDYKALYESDKKFFDYWAKDPYLTQGFARKLWWVLNYPLEDVASESYHKALGKLWITPNPPKK